MLEKVSFKTRSFLLPVMIHSKAFATFAMMLLAKVPMAVKTPVIFNFRFHCNVISSTSTYRAVDGRKNSLPNAENTTLRKTTNQKSAQVDPAYMKPYPMMKLDGGLQAR